jgi:sugar phosphate isomerase/epimerase
MSVSKPHGGDGEGLSPPRLLTGLSFVTIADLPSWSSGPKGDTAQIYAALDEAGYEGIQTLEPATACGAGLIPFGIARVIDDLDQLRAVARHWRDQGCACTTVQLGTGLEEDDDLCRLAEGMLHIAEQERHPLHLETHRATMTQDIRRTLGLIERFPELTFNGDFAHWYIGHELPYGDIEAKLVAMRPVFERIRFLHLRVSSGAFGQLTASDPAEAQHLAIFRRMWTESIGGFLLTARSGDYLPALCELLPARTFYPKMVTGPDGSPREESDRWTETAFLTEQTRVCFDAAVRNIAASARPVLPMLASTDGRE